MRIKAPGKLISVCLLSFGVLASESTLGEQAVHASSLSKSQQRARKKMTKQVEKESAFACNVAGLDGAQRQRWEKLIEAMAAAKQEVRELPDGYAFRFPSESAMVKDLAEFIVYERLCCPFFDFEIAVEREGGPLWLRLKGRPGVKKFIKSEFGL